MAPNITVINPAAGPLMVSFPLLKKVVTNPPITHESKPDKGCTPEAIAIAIDNGRATKATLSDAMRSFRQFCFKPANPSLGMSSVRLWYMGF